MKTHLLLISKQVIPNLTPLLDPEIKPEAVIMLVSKDMQKRAEWLQKILLPQGIKCRVVEIDDAYDIQSIGHKVYELIIENDGLVLNATGGTKLMSIAAYEEFRSENLPIYYVHPESDLMIWMHDKEQKSHQIADRIKLDKFLVAHGATVTSLSQQKPKTEEIELADRVIHELAYFRRAVTEINFLAQKAKNTLTSPKISDINISNTDAFDDLIDLFTRNGYLTQRDGRLIFSREENRFFVNGGWIEHWVYDKVREFGKQAVFVHDTASNIKIERYLNRGKPVRNEIDAAFLYNNRLHIIECKTRKLKLEDTAGADTLYKLETLKPIMGGLQARAMLVSLLDVPDRDRTRAAELNISICSGEQLKNFDEHLKKFVK